MTDSNPMSVTRKAWAEVRALDTGANITLGPNTVDRYLTDPENRLLSFPLQVRREDAVRLQKHCRYRLRRWIWHAHISGRYQSYDSAGS